MKISFCKKFRNDLSEPGGGQLCELPNCEFSVPAGNHDLHRGERNGHLHHEAITPYHIIFILKGVYTKVNKYNVSFDLSLSHGDQVFFNWIIRNLSVTGMYNFRSVFTFF